MKKIFFVNKPRQVPRWSHIVWETDKQPYMKYGKIFDFCLWSKKALLGWSGSQKNDIFLEKKEIKKKNFLKKQLIIFFDKNNSSTTNYL